MLQKCANPGCASQYRYFREGVLFEFQVDIENTYYPLTSPAPRGAKREIFWLCDDCSSRLTLECRDAAVALVPLAKRKTA